jgi:hypothetical protein
VTRCAFIGTNPTGELITSGLPGIRAASSATLNAMLLALDPEAEDIEEEHASAQDVCERL